MNSKRIFLTSLIIYLITIISIFGYYSFTHQDLGWTLIGLIYSPVTVFPIILLVVFCVTIIKELDFFKRRDYNGIFSHIVITSLIALSFITIVILFDGIANDFNDLSLGDEGEDRFSLISILTILMQVSILGAVGGIFIWILNRLIK